MAEESFQEKTEQATPKRKDDARKKGQVARSAELSSVAILMFGLLALWGLGSYMYDRLSGLMIESFTNGLTINLDTVTIQPHITRWVGGFIAIVTPMVAVLVVAAIAVNVSQVGVLFTGQPLQPKAERISPLAGVKRIFSKKGLVELAKGLFKIGVVALITFTTLKSEADTLLGLVHMSIGQIFALGADLVLDLGFQAALILLLMAVLDYAFQRWDYENNLKMTKQELKEEQKQQEGDPVLRSRVRSLQRDMSRKRMMSDVGESDVVVANPTHVAVALKYDPANMAAPIVMAKGQRLIAQKIKELAREAGVPVVENKPLARALFKAVQVGQAIPEDLFRATAEVLAFVFQMRRGKQVASEVGT